MRLDIYTHYFKVTEFSDLAHKAIGRFCVHLTQSETKTNRFGVVEKTDDTTYAARTGNCSEYRFIISCLDTFIRYLDVVAGIPANSLIKVDHRNDKPFGQPVKLVPDPKFIPRDYQGALINHAARIPVPGKEDVPTYKRILEIQTGRGKTKMALYAIYLMSQRTFIQLKPMYIQKWINDIKEMFDEFPGNEFKKSDIIAVSGNKQLATTIALAKEGLLEAKFIIVSNRTLQIFIEEYEEGLDVEAKYGCKPDELMELLKIGIKLTDEVHEFFHLNFKADLYTHNVQSIELSATLNPKEKFVIAMYEFMLPLKCRATMAYHKYAEAISLHYRFADPKRIRCKMGGRYSHTEFEKSIRRNKRALKDYFQFMKDVMDGIFINEYQEGERLLVFFGLVDMCNDFGEIIKENYPDLKTTVYVSGSKEETLKENDIIISTLKSCGTARDIPDLTRVLNTVAHDTPQGGLQYLGRLRELKHRPHLVPKYYYTTATNIDKHMRYEKNKIPLFEGKVTKHYSLETGVCIAA